MEIRLNSIINLVKKEFIFFVVLILAIFSCLFVKPSLSYLDYIDWKTIVILFIMMIFVQVLNNVGIFDRLINALLDKVNSSRSLVFVLVFICFFSSIFITNDIALLTFVPFSIIALKKVNLEYLVIITVVLQTIAANMGSMILPIGSPHNIFMYSISGISFKSFIVLLLPYVIISFIFLIICCLFIKSENIEVSVSNFNKSEETSFFMRIFSGVDYFLLLTFIGLFILIGNLQNISEVIGFFKSIIVGNELFCGIIASQFISNVPAGMVLSGFSNNYELIIVGINIGGLGTLIASMANLISYKLFVNEFNNLKFKYLAVFSILNVILLIILLVFYFITN